MYTHIIFNHSIIVITFEGQLIFNTLRAAAAVGTP